MPHEQQSPTHNEPVLRDLVARGATAILTRRAAWVGGAVVLAASLLLYLLTLDDGLRLGELLGGDLITHQYAQVQARPANAPGYPLYTALGWVWFRIGHALLGFWLNSTQVLSLYSTLWALGALLVLYLLLLEVTRRNALISTLVTLAFAATYFFWYYAVTTEQYTSAVLQTLLIIWLAFRWERTRQDRTLLWLALVTGISLAHMITVLLILPPLVAFLLLTERNLIRRPKLIAGCVLVGLLPLLSYAYVYVRGMQHPEWRGVGSWSTTWAWFLSFLSTRQGWGELTWTLGGFSDEFVPLVTGELTIIGLMLGFVGIALLGRRRALFLLSTLALYVAFSYIDRQGNWYQVIMPMYPVIMLGIGVVAARTWEAGSGRTWLRCVVILALLVLGVRNLHTNLPRADQSAQPDATGLQSGLAILCDDPAPGAAIIANYEESLSLAYVTQIWGQRPDLEIVPAADAHQILEAGQRPLYATVNVLPLVLAENLRAYLACHGARLVQIQAQPQTALPDAQHLLHLDLGDHLRLLGYDILAYEDQWLHLALYWQATGAVQRDYAISVRPTAGGQLLSSDSGLIQSDRPHPVWGAYPTSGWQDGEVVRDDYVLSVPFRQPYDGAVVVVYWIEDDQFENLAVVSLDLGPPR